MNQRVRNERVGSTMKRGKRWSKQKFSTFFFRAFQFFFPLFLSSYNWKTKSFRVPKKKKNNAFKDSNYMQKCTIFDIFIFNGLLRSCYFINYSLILFGSSIP